MIKNRNNNLFFIIINRVKKFIKFQKISIKYFPTFFKKVFKLRFFFSLFASYFKLNFSDTFRIPLDSFQFS